MRVAAIALALVMAAAPAWARDKTGNFMIGGGVGGIHCPEFLDAVAQARQAGGFKTVAGVNLLNPFVQYVLGFETGFNLINTEVYDVFANLGDDPGGSAIYAIEPYCQQHPDKRFGDGVLWLAATLMGGQ
jgi:hypothetical protein